MNWDYCTYVPLLYEASRMTSGTVVEIGVGLCSTPLLDALVTFGPTPRHLISIDSDEKWISVLQSRYKSVHHEFIHVTNYHDQLEQLASEKPSLVFIDNGSVKDIQEAKRLRWEMIHLFRDSEVLVVHDGSNLIHETTEFNSYIKLGEMFEFFIEDRHAQPTTLWLSNKRRPLYQMR